MGNNSYDNELKDRRYKKRVKAPCIFKDVNPRTNKPEDFYPTVQCQFNCSKCGWNPDVRKLRVAKARAEIESKRIGERNK